MCGYMGRKNLSREMMHHLRCLFFIAEHFHITVHLPGKENEWTDALSCNNIPGFLQVSAGAGTTPTHLPSQALALLVEKQPDWTSSGHNCVLSGLDFKASSGSVGIILDDLLPGFLFRYGLTRLTATLSILLGTKCL